MTEMLTRFLAMGFTLEQVIEMSTINPAKALGEEDRLGSLGIGKQADISVLDIKEGDWVVYDVLRGSRKFDKAIVPVLAVKRGEIFEAGWGPRPWGWEPDQA
jgi:dihydroorotase